MNRGGDVATFRLFINATFFLDILGIALLYHVDFCSADFTITVHNVANVKWREATGSLCILASLIIGFVSIFWEDHKG